MGLWDSREGSREVPRGQKGRGGLENTREPQGRPAPPCLGHTGALVTSLADIPLRCKWSARLQPPARSVQQDGDGTGQEPGAGEEPPSAAHVFPRGAEAFCRSFPLVHPYPFHPSRMMAERSPSCPGVACEEDGAPQDSSSLPQPDEVCVVQPLQIGE